jgi:hypothetical protein
MDATGQTHFPDAALPRPTAAALKEAREIAGELFAAASRPDLAAQARRGDGDDFTEVTVLAGMLQRRADWAAQQEQALRWYADESFWDDQLPGGSLALHDRGEIARNVLAGRRPFYHRD